MISLNVIVSQPNLSLYNLDLATYSTSSTSRPTPKHQVECSPSYAHLSRQYLGLKLKSSLLLHKYTAQIKFHVLVHILKLTFLLTVLTTSFSTEFQANS